MRFKVKPYRLADVILTKHGREHAEIITCLEDLSPVEGHRNRPEMSKLFKDLFSLRRWHYGIEVFDQPDIASGKIDFMKGRIAVQVSFNHYLRIGTELLRFETLSYSDQNRIDVGVYVTITKALVNNWDNGFAGSITHEQACSYYERFKNAITVPVLFVGLLPDE
jgi:hypothetical protein